MLALLDPHKTPEEQFTQLYQRYKSTKRVSDAADALKHARRHQLYEPKRVFALGERLVKPSGSPSGHLQEEEGWSVVEQFMLAALNCGTPERVDIARQCLITLEAKFPGSQRVARLRGVFLEQAGDWKGAHAVLCRQQSGALVFMHDCIDIKGEENKWWVLPAWMATQ